MEVEGNVSIHLKVCRFLVFHFERLFGRKENLFISVYLFGGSGIWWIKP